MLRSESDIVLGSSYTGPTAKQQRDDTHGMSDPHINVPIDFNAHDAAIRLP